ncbi:hypothetical protein FQR65_LT08173 [Abscondita terminalis]|nr:hypothetical protein FQR65_LT08173 [Abscondita terminalis]
MQEKREIDMLNVRNQEIYERVPPEGGWGYLVALCIVITFSVTFIPVCAFGMIFGKFLESHGDEASATGLISGTYLAFQWSSGIIANPLLQKISYRKVAILGTSLLFSGAFSLLFVNSIHQLLISFSVLQGLGFGLIICSSLTAFNCYFEKRRNFILSASNAIMILLIAAFPTLVSYCMNNYGFRGTLLIIAGINLNCLPAVLCLQPAKWHMKKSLKIIENKENIKPSSDDTKLLDEQRLSLLKSYKQQYSENIIVDSEYLEKDSSVCLNLLKNISNYLDLGLFLDPIYVNVAMGLSLCLASDYAFVTTLPLLLASFNLESSNLVLLMTIFYIADVIGRILLSVLNAFTNIDARHLTLLGAILAVIFRTSKHNRLNIFFLF